MNIKWDDIPDDKKLLAKLDSENRSHIRTINNLIEHMDDGGYVSQLQTELAAVKAEQNHQNKGVMDLQDKYDKVVAERDKMKEFVACCPHLPNCYRVRMNEKAKGVKWEDLPCVCGRDKALEESDGE